MITRLRFWRERLFPDRQMLLRSGGGTRLVTLPGWLQAMATFVAVAMVGALTGLTGAYLHAHRIIHVKQAEMQLAEMSNAEVGALVTELRSQLDVVNAQHDGMNAQYEAAQNELEQRLRAAEQGLSNKSGAAAQLAKALEESRAELRRSEQARGLLQANIRQLEAALQGANARAKELKLALDRSGKQAQQEHAPPQNPNKRQLAAAGAGSTSAPAREPRATSAGGQLERLIASTGLDIERLLGQFGSLPPNQGGPYVALDDARKAEVAHSQRRVEELEKLVKTLPLGAPLVHYQLESGFGQRADPFHGRQAFHSGIDLAAPYRTPIYATGPGVVIFTGVKDNYGRVVEIDHGHGIVTRYAHLHRILVARGQKVDTHTEIAQLGSTGRSTGPHVHYEVLVDGVAQDPEKFIEAGHGIVEASSK